MIKIFEVLALCLLIPVLLFGFVLYIIFSPFDMIRYYRMPYYRDLKKKYHLFITSSDIVKLYNKIRNENLPIEYHCNEGFEYFVKDNQVLICDWKYEDFEIIDNEWYCFLESEENGFEEKEKVLISDIIDEECEALKPEHKALDKKILLFYDNITDCEVAERVEECPYFYYLFSGNEMF